MLVIDPGDNAPELLEALRERDLRIVGVIATHSHLDHTGGIHELLEAALDAGFAMHADDYPAIAAQAGSARMWYGHDVTPPREPDRYLEHGGSIAVGAHTLTALHCPGHTPGSLCLYAEQGPDGAGIVLTGDVLFAGSVGRTDFPGGDTRALITSIRAHLLALPDDTAVLPGHNEESTIGEERRSNPFLVDPRATLGVDVD